MHYFCLDCEASGPMAPLYNLLSVGITVVRPDGESYLLGDTFYIELKPVFPGFDDGALAVCGLDVDRLAREGVEPGDAMLRIREWVLRQNVPSTERPVFVGHNAVFDWAYINYYFKHFGVGNPFGYKGICTKSLAMGRLGVAWNETSKENLEDVLGLPAQDPEKIHRADYDAHYQALILKSLLEMPVG